jgi:hypothetical protein
MASGSTDIRYVCLSDMHLGEEDSLLTNLSPGSTQIDPFHASPVLQELVYCLRDLIFRNDVTRQIWEHVELKLKGLTLNVTLGASPKINVEIK